MTLINKLNTHTLIYSFYNIILFAYIESLTRLDKIVILSLKNRSNFQIEKFSIISLQSRDAANVYSTNKDNSRFCHKLTQLHFDNNGKSDYNIFI